jgi:hypothetical protein
LSQDNLAPLPSFLIKAVFGPACPIYPFGLSGNIPVSVWKQCSLNVSVSSISMPELPCSGDSWEPMAKSLHAKEESWECTPVVTQVTLPAFQPEAVKRGSMNCWAAMSQFLLRSFGFSIYFTTQCTLLPILLQNMSL